jgi:hypothetical protein
MMVIIVLQTVAKIQNQIVFLYIYFITLLVTIKNNQRNKRRDITNKTTQGQDYLLLISAITFLASLLSQE